MRSITLLMESFTSQVETLRVITCATGSCRTALPLSAIMRTMSRSDRTPARRPSTPRDHQRANTMLSEQLGRGGKISSKIDAHDLAALCGKNSLQAHAPSPLETLTILLFEQCIEPGAVRTKLAEVFGSYALGQFMFATTFFGCRQRTAVADRA